MPAKISTLSRWRQEPVDTDDEDKPDYIDQNARANQQQWMVVPGVTPQQGVADAGLGLRDFYVQFDWSSARQNYPTKEVLNSFVAQAKQNTLDAEGQYLAPPVTLSREQNEVLKWCSSRWPRYKTQKTTRKSESLYKVKEEHEKVRWFNCHR